MYKSMGDHPDGFGNFFLVRPRGVNPNTGEKYVPSTVQYYEGALYSPNNEISPLVWSRKGNILAPTIYVYEADLEWMNLPE